MSRTRQAAVNPIAIFAIAVIVVALVIAGLGTSLLKGAKQRSEEREAERKSMVEFLGQAKKLNEGGKLGNMPDFPETSIGRMQRIVFVWARTGQTRTEELMKRLTELGWDWVGSPESLRTKASLEKCLSISPKVKAAVLAHRKWFDEGYSKVLADVESQADGSRDARSFVAGLKESSQREKGGYQLGLKTWDVLVKNIEALEEMFRFLLARSGKYKVAEDGTIEFDASVSDRDAEAYNAITDRVNGQLQEMNRLEAERLRISQENFERATKELSK